MLYNFVPDSFHTYVTAEALRAKIDRISTISHQCGHLDPKFQVQGVAPPPLIIFARLVMPMNALQLCRWQFLHKKNFVADCLQAKSDFCANRPFCVFRPPLRNLGATYDDHLRFIGKRVVDFLLASIELFSLGVTSEALLTEASSGNVWPPLRSSACMCERWHLSLVGLLQNVIWLVRANYSRASSRPTDLAVQSLHWRYPKHIPFFMNRGS